MPLQILGLNHNTAPIEIREQVVFSGEDLARALRAVVGIPGVDEAVLLSTCNRTEFYVNATADGCDALRAWLRNERPLPDIIDGALFELQESEAVAHLFRVACGLDSMVLGETQILGQLKDAYRDAETAGALGPEITRVMQHTFAVAKKIRTDTEIGRSAVSVASAAVNLAGQFFSGFKKHTALLVGAGATVELLATHLRSHDIGRLFVANRSIDNAQVLANRYGGFALPLSEIDGTLPEADILITSTASSVPIISYAQMQAAIKARKRKPIFAVDIAVPRDIDEAVRELEDVYLYTVDDLDRVAQQGQHDREAAAIEANGILEDEIERYLSLQRAKQSVPTIAALRDHGDAIRDQVIAEAERRLARGATPEEAIRYAAASLMKKLLHNPSIALREAGASADEELLAAARKLFDLDSKQ